MKSNKKFMTFWFNSVFIRFLTVPFHICESWSANYAFAKWQERCYKSFAMWYYLDIFQCQNLYQTWDSVEMEIFVIYAEATVQRCSSKKAALMKRRSKHRYFPVDFAKIHFFTVAAYAHAWYILSMKIPSRLRFLAFNSCLDSQMVICSFYLTNISFFFTRNF